MQWKWGFLVGMTLALIACLLSTQWRGRRTMPANITSSQVKAQENFGKLPLYFVENRGQVDTRVAFYAQGREKAIYFTAHGLTFVLNHPSPPSKLEPASLRAEASARASQTRYTLQLEFVNARADLHPVGREQTEAVFSYFKGARAQTGLKSYAQVVYENVWPGIDLIYAGTVNRMKYSFLVKPGADPNQIRLAWHGASGLAVNPAGGLDVQTPAGGFTDERPVSWQELDGARREVATAYSINEQRGVPEYSFRLGAYDRSQELVIDPVVLVYCGFIGGSFSDIGGDIAVDQSGNVYVVGYTSSSELLGFPLTVGPDVTANGSLDAFVAKVKADGTGLVYCGYIGGSEADQASGIAIDSAGNAYVTGRTGSRETQGFPVTVGPDLTYNNRGDVFVAKVNASGTELLYCGYIGGEWDEGGNAIALDSVGNAYLTGITRSSERDGFPVLIGPDTSYNGGAVDSGTDDAFVAKVKADGTGLEYCGYVGGGAFEVGQGIAVDSTGNAYVTGTTESSPAQNFPITVGPDLTHNGLSDAFVAKVKANGTSLEYCGYIGGSRLETAEDIALDKAGNAYLVGSTTSSEMQGFPVRIGPDTTHNGIGDVFVAKVNHNGSELVYCGFIGGSAGEMGAGIAVDSVGRAFVTGGTRSSREQGFPLTTGPNINADHPGTGSDNREDAFVAVVAPTGSELDYCRYLGGRLNEFGQAIAVDTSGSFYVTGSVDSTEADGFPVRVGPDTTYNSLSDGGPDAFVAKFSENQAPIAKCQNVKVVAAANCTANATIDNGSYDPDGDAITLRQIPPGPYPRGTTTVTLQVTDSNGAISECTATVTVVDKTPPTITKLNANPSVLWPPNHKLVYVTMNYNIADNCDNAAALHCQLSVQSNEPVKGQGDGDAAPDWIVIDTHHVWLRAERDGKGNGRVYTITITCQDSAGQTSCRTVTVKVPKSQGK